MDKNTVLTQLEKDLENLNKIVRQKVSHLYSSGGIDPESYPSNGISLTQTLLISALQDIVVYRLGSASDKVVDDIENLKHF